MPDTRGPSACKPRTRTGCITCRIRRVKCDETKPRCTRCTQSRRTCDGYTSPAAAGLSRPTLAAAVRHLAAVGPASRVLAGPETAGDAACFDFFRLRAAHTGGSFFPSEFWGRIVLQSAHGEPAVWAAAAALGALHRRWETSSSATAGALGDGGGEVVVGGGELSDRFSRQAAVCYGRALALSRSIQTPWSMLVLSLALAAAANLAGRWTDIRIHTISAQRLLDQVTAEKHASDPSQKDIRDAAESLVRINLQAILFSEATAPYPYHESDWPERGPVSPTLAIGSLDEAAAQLLDIFSRLMILAGREVVGGMTCPVHVFELEMDLGKEVAAWEACMMEYLKTAGTSHLMKQETALLSIKLYHALVRAVLKAGIPGPETRWDACLGHFERILYLSLTMLRLTPSLAPSVASVDMGVVMPLFFTARRCRHPVLRRSAVTLLQQARRQEGRWKGSGAAAVVAKIISLEEAGLGIEAPELTYLHAAKARQRAKQVSEEDAWQWLGGDADWVASSTWVGVVKVPEWQRLVDVDVAADADASTARMNLMYSDRDEIGARRVGRAVVSF